MSEWDEFLASVQTHLNELAESGCDIPFFRGHNDSKWHLLSGLGRRSPSEFKKQHLEAILYYDFMSLGGSLLGKHADSWDVLFAMQHHGLPTRLLDWTTTFSAALYFALRPYLHIKNYPENISILPTPCVWILDPFELSRLNQLEPTIANPYVDFDGSYQETFIDQSKKLGASVIAINPPQHTPRQTAQRSVFTLHDDLFTPLETLAKNTVKKFEVPINAIQPAASFLSLAGMNEFSVFPDLDGLARHLRDEHVSPL